MSVSEAVAGDEAAAADVFDRRAFGLANSNCADDDAGALEFNSAVCFLDAAFFGAVFAGDAVVEAAGLAAGVASMLSRLLVLAELEYELFERRLMIIESSPRFE